MLNKYDFQKSFGVIFLENLSKVVPFTFCHLPNYFYIVQKNFFFLEVALPSQGVDFTNPFTLYPKLLRSTPRFYTIF